MACIYGHYMVYVLADIKRTHGLTDSNTRIEVLYLSENDIQNLSIGLGKLVELVEYAFNARRNGQVLAYPKQSLHVGDSPIFFQSLPSVQMGGYASVKWIGVGNAEHLKHSPQIKALICLSDACTAEPLAILDANWITGMRTAAVSLLGARLLLESLEGVLGIFGTGVQAFTHLEFFASAGLLRELVVWGRNKDRVSLICDVAKSLNIETSVANEQAEVLRRADIVVSALGANTSSEIGLDGTQLRTTAYVSLVDLGRPWKFETLRHVRMYTDDRELTMRLMHEGKLPAETTIVDDLVHLSGRATVCRSDVPVCLLHPGVGYADLVVAGYIFEKAQAMQMGTKL